VALGGAPGIRGRVGPKGWGKTTLLNLLSGLIHPDSGEVLLRGLSPRRPELLMRITGYATQYDAAPRWSTGLSYVATGLRLRGYDGPAAEKTAWETLDRLGMAEAAGRKMAAYSKGMRQRVRLAQAIAHEPDILLLDEPLNGLDPLVRAETIALLRSLAARGRHVILSSHVLEEVDLVSDQVILVANGMVVAEGKIRDVRGEILERPSQFLVRSDDAHRLAAELFRENHVSEVRLHEDRAGLLAMTGDAARFLESLGRLAAAGYRIDSVIPADENADALYAYLIGGER